MQNLFSRGLLALFRCSGVSFTTRLRKERRGPTPAERSDNGHPRAVEVMVTTTGRGSGTLKSCPGSLRI